MVASYLIATAMILLWQDAPATARVIDVCSALTQLRDLEGKTVFVRGEYVVSKEVSALRGINCTGKLLLDGARWGWAISVVFAPGAHRDKLSAAESLGEAVKRKSCSTCRVVTTFRGRLKSVLDTSSLTYNPDPRARLGFGHLGAFPAEITVFSVEDIRMEDVSKEK